MTILALLLQLLGILLLAGLVLTFIFGLCWLLTTPQQKQEWRVWWAQLTWRPKKK